MYRFGVFEFCVDSGELRKRGQRVRLPEKSRQALLFLIEHAGQVVTREQLRKHLWADGTFVEFDDNLNSTIRRVRDALGDSAEDSRYLETIPRRGYRFVAPMEPALPFETLRDRWRPRPGNGIGGRWLWLVDSPWRSSFWLYSRPIVIPLPGLPTLQSDWPCYRFGI